MDAHPAEVRGRLPGTESNEKLVRVTYPVVFRNRRMLVRIFEPKDPGQGAHVEILPADQPPSTIRRGSKIEWSE
jgi:hypothetical protein